MAEAEYWRFTVARDCQKKNTSENHSECRLEARVRCGHPGVSSVCPASGVSGGLRHPGVVPSGRRSVEGGSSSSQTLRLSVNCCKKRALAARRP
jgi:hypothetical protein